MQKTKFASNTFLSSMYNFVLSHEYTIFQIQVYSLISVEYEIKKDEIHYNRLQFNSSNRALIADRIHITCFCMSLFAVQGDYKS